MRSRFDSEGFPTATITIENGAELGYVHLIQDVRVISRPCALYTQLFVSIDI